MGSLGGGPHAELGFGVSATTHCFWGGSMHGLFLPLGALRDLGGCSGREEGGPRRLSPPLPCPALSCSPGLQLPDQLGLRGGGMPVNGAPWDPQGLQTVGIILLLCSSLKLLHALGIIDLTGGGGARNRDGGENGDGSEKWGRGHNGDGVAMGCGRFGVAPCLLSQDSMCAGAMRCSGEA